LAVADRAVSHDAHRVVGASDEEAVFLLRVAAEIGEAADQHAVEPRQVTAAARRCRMAARMSSREDGARLVNGLSYVLSGLATEVAVHRCVVAVAQTTPGSGAL